MIFSSKCACISSTILTFLHNNLVCFYTKNSQKVDFSSAKFVQKTITKNGCIPRGTVVFWSLNLLKMDQFCKICPKNHYKKRLYLPRDSRFLDSKSSKNGSILQKLSKNHYKKRLYLPRDSRFFWSLNLQKMDQFYKIYPKNHYKKRLYPPRDSHFLEFIDFSHIHFVILQHYGVILTKLITNLDEFYIFFNINKRYFSKKSV